MATQTFTSTGTWVCPSFVSKITVECWGAGGHGATSTSGGGGGGGGAYKKVLNIPVYQNKTYKVTVGPLTESGNGQSSSFTGESSVQCLAEGGAQGWSGTGGAGATGTYNGGAGANGLAAGGGEAAGASSNGNNAIGTSGGTGASGADGGDGGTLGHPTGYDGGGPGGGGGAGYPPNYNGGKGANGQVVLTWTVDTNVVVSNTILG